VTDSEEDKKIMTMSVPQDNRQFIEDLKQYNQLVTIDQEVDWDLEMGAISRRACEKKSAAPFFQKVKDYPGWRVLGAPMATYERLAIGMGLDPSSSIAILQKEYLERTKKPAGKPLLIDQKNAPCKSNVISGKEINLFDLPAPMVHGGDGGRYLCTWHMLVTKSLDSRNYTNWGMYRQMIADERTLVGAIHPSSDLGRMLKQEYEPRNMPVPFATVIGPSPMEALAACSPTPIQEFEFAGQLMKSPVALTECETSDLLVPAQAEIIIEGKIMPNVGIEEGPFGEYTGYRSSLRAPRVTFRVSAISYRDNPILTMTNMGVPVDEGQLLRSFTLALEVRRLLESQNIPVTGVYMLPESTHHLMVVGTKVQYANIAKQIANLVFGGKSGQWFHILIVVDEDTDIYSKDEIIHALSTKCHPINGIRQYPNDIGTAHTPFSSPFERQWNIGHKVLFDCTWPPNWTENEKPIKICFANEAIYPKAIQEKVLNNWQRYGFKD